MSLKLAIALNTNRRRQEEITDLSGGSFSVVHFADATGTGGGLLQLSFPVMFAERPAFNYGFEMAPNQPLITNRFPTCSCGVYSWNIQYRKDTGARYWAGASMVVVITGPDGDLGTNQLMTIHAHFQGRSVQPG